MKWKGNPLVDLNIGFTACSGVCVFSGVYKTVDLNSWKKIEKLFDS